MAAVNDSVTSSDQIAEPGRVRRWLYAARMLPRLQRRVEDLEEAVVELRRIDRRTAELIDVVAEVLLPATERDEEAVRRRLDAYVKGL